MKTARTSGNDEARRLFPPSLVGDGRKMETGSDFEFEKGQKASLINSTPTRRDARKTI